MERFRRSWRLAKASWAVLKTGWLRTPDRRLSGLWLLSEVARGDRMDAATG